MSDSLLSFIFAATLLTLTPGLDTTLLLRTATVEGKSQAFQAGLGIITGCLAWGILIALGLGAFLAVSTVAYEILKWAGAGYLCWLAFHLLVKPTAPPTTEVFDKAKNKTNWFIKGCISNLLNPKVGVFYISFLPQFIPATAHVAAWTMCLVLIHTAISIIWFAILILMTATMSRLFQHAQFTRWMDRVTGGVLLFFAFKLLNSSHKN